MKFTQVASVSCLATVALGATVKVTVGPGLAYSPDSITADKGDVVEFHFGSGHNVVSGKFSSPCQPDGLIYSGNPSDGDVFSVTVNNTEPMWIYCAVPHHCESGMAMSINAPSNETIAEYKSAAAKVSSSNSPKEVTGGVLSTSSSSSSSSNSTSSAAHSSATMSGTRTSGTMSATGASQTSSSASATSTNGASTAFGSSSSTIFSTFAVLAVAFGLTV